MQNLAGNSDLLVADSDSVGSTTFILMEGFMAIIVVKGSLL
jgi:hypothetical protein